MGTTPPLPGRKPKPEPIPCATTLQQVLDVATVALQSSDPEDYKAAILAINALSEPSEEEPLYSAE